MRWDPLNVLRKGVNSTKQGCVAMGIFFIVNAQPKYWDYSLYLLSLSDTSNFASEVWTTGICGLYFSVRTLM